MLAIEISGGGNDSSGKAAESLVHLETYLKAPVDHSLGLQPLY